MENYLDMIREIDPERTALILHDQTYRYGDLVKLAVDKQKEIAQDGGRRIHVVREKGILDQLTGFLACQGTNRVPLIVPLDADVPEEFLKKKLPKDVCMAVMTSGTSGKNKLLLRTFESWHSYFEIQNRIFHIGPESRLFMQGSLAFTGNLNLYMAQLSAGAVILAEEIFDPRVWKCDMETYHADGIYLIPAKLRALRQVYERKTLKRGQAVKDPDKMPIRLENRTIRTILSGSQSLGGEEAEQFAAVFPNADLILYYGASELNYITYVHGSDMGKDQTLIGKPFPEVQVSLHDGEIHVTTKYGVTGTKEQEFIGDFGHWDENGNLYFDGRRDDICNINGRKVSAIRVENALLAVPGVEEAAVCARKSNGHDILAAWITWDPAADTETGNTDEARKREIHAKLAKILPEAEIPKRIMLLDQMPKNESGKILKRELTI